MPQLFRPRANTVARASIAAAVLLLAFTAWAVYAGWWSSYITGRDVPRDQQVPFSHQHHVNGLGIDCRYCHVSATASAFAGIPPTHICMTCHSQLFTEEPMLAPVRQSLATGKPLVWRRVHDLPGFVYFNHQAHLAKGVGCTTCHGAVNQMPLMWAANALYMKWCLECHRDPARFVRPRDEVFSIDWQPPPDQLERGRVLVREYGINTRQLTDCGICHR